MQAGEVAAVADAAGDLAEAAGDLAIAAEGETDAVQIAAIDAAATVAISQDHNATQLAVAEIAADATEDDVSWLETRLAELRSEFVSALSSAVQDLKSHWTMEADRLMASMSAMEAAEALALSEPPTEQPLIMEAEAELTQTASEPGQIVAEAINPASEGGGAPAKSKRFFRL
jgi:hypothetical protein